MEQTLCTCTHEDEKLVELKRKLKNIKELDGALIPALHEVQNLYGYLPEDVLEVVSEELNVPMSEIFGVATFYSFFSLKPKGEYLIRVCLGTACYVKGSQEVLDKFSEKLNLAVDGTTEDGKFTLEASRCLGACGLAPVITINDDVYGKLTPKMVDEIIAKYKG